MSSTRRSNEKTAPYTSFYEVRAFLKTSPESTEEVLKDTETFIAKDVYSVLKIINMSARPTSQWIKERGVYILSLAFGHIEVRPVKILST